jgi:glycosyltransferase involved in cell wall biosynthesis
MSDPAVLRTLGRVEDAAVEPILDEVAQSFCTSKDANGVTIFIPNWNQRAFLPRAIGSALRALDALSRGGVPGEVIVLDDASRDGSQKLLRSVEMARGDNRLATVFLRRNVGLPRVRNAGLGLARYRSILFLDADNELVPENLPLFFAAMRETGAALVYGNLLDRSADGIVGARSNRLPTMELFDGNYIDALALLDVEQVLQTGGFSTLPELYGYEDWELILSLIEHELELVFVPAVLGYYTVGRRSMLRETELRAKDRWQLIQRLHAPRGTRGWDPRRVGRAYDPRIGFLAEHRAEP